MKEKAPEFREYNPYQNVREKAPMGRTSLFAPFDSRKFTSEIERRGLRILSERKEGDEQILTVELESGSYHLEAGFSEFNPNDNRYRYSNNAPEKQDAPLILDVEHPAFKKLDRELVLQLQQQGFDFRFDQGDPQKLEQIIQAIDTVMRQNMRSHERTEDVTKLSEIIESGESACAGESLVAGLLLQKRFQPRTGFKSLDVRQINGSSAHFEGQRPHDIGHAWLRISDGGGNVALYDPHYKQYKIYNLNNLQIDTDDPFKQYGVEAGFMGHIHNNSKAGLKRVGGIKLVESMRGTTEVWVHTVEAHPAQISGYRKLAFDTEGGTVELHNGAFYLSKKPTSEARYLEPLIDINKVG
jgi:hypothetical protein